jgi:TRAP-type uncharacterized transport system fused permease subunit
MKPHQEIGTPPEKRERQWGTRRVLIFIIALSMALFHMYTAGVRQLPGVQQRTIHLSFALALIFLLFPFKAKSDEAGGVKVADEHRPITIFDLFLMLSSLLAFTCSSSTRTSVFALASNFLDTFAAFGHSLVLEATRRVIGWAIVIICFVGFVYLPLVLISFLFSPYRFYL